MSLEWPVPDSTVPDSTNDAASDTSALQLDDASGEDVDTQQTIE